MVYNTDKTKEQTIDEALFKILLVLVPSISRAVSVVNDFFNIDIKYLLSVKCNPYPQDGHCCISITFNTIKVICSMYKHSHNKV